MSSTAIEATPELLTLTAGALAIDVWPELGGSIVEMRHGGAPFSQPLAEGWARRRNPSELAHFGMVPWFSRIVGGTFDFGGETFTIPVERADLTHFGHGFLRYRRPVMARMGDTELVFTDDYAEPASPYRYRSLMRYRLDESGLEVSLAVTNTGERPMPFALGFHPFFRRDPDVELGFSADGFLAVDETAMPVAWCPIAQRPTLADGAGLTELFGLNNSFTGWQGPAIIRYPSRGLTLSVTAEADVPLVLHAYVPRDRDVLCIEPVTNIPDAIHRPSLAEHGAMVPLASGESLSGRMRIDVAGATG